MRELVFLLEEQSARAMLEGLLPGLLPTEAVVRYIVFEGKQDLERQLPRKLRAYRNPEASFLILRDQDAAPDCRQLKEKLVALCHSVGRPEAVVRIAFRELEAFYLADLRAVATAYDMPRLVELQGKRRYRSPDGIESPSRELAKLTNDRYQKVSGSRAIGPLLDLENVRSASFRHLVSAIRGLSGT